MNQMKKEELEITISDSDCIECAIRHIELFSNVDPWAAEIAVEAMRKQIPMGLGSKVLDYLGRARHECGNCGEVIEDAMWDYCPWCGQRIGGE